jgi:hypothetical protein
MSFLRPGGRRPTESSAAVGRRLRALTLAIVAAGALVAAGVAPTAPATAMAKEGGAELKARRHFAVGEYQEALDVYANLYAETLHPTYLRNIGRCYQKLREPDRAIDSFEEYLRKGKNLPAEQIAEVKGYIAEMEELKRSRAAAAVPAAPAGTNAGVRPEPAAGAGANVPAPALEPAPPPVEPPSAVARPEPPPESSPFYTRFWFWAAVGVVAVGLTTALLLFGADRTPDTGNLGVFDARDRRP